jgi:2-polyprenyl-6-methoxyphenol hydroxylase-like FAD-dependent oxidoreductase
MKGGAYHDAIVVGGGFGGLVAAASLAEVGLDVAVVEERLATAKRGLRGELLHPSAVRELTRLGVERALCARGAAHIAGMVACAPALSEVATLPYAGNGLALEHELIIDGLREELASRPRIHLFQGSVRTVVRADGVVVGARCRDGRVVSSPLVIVADGRHSQLRGELGITASRTLLSHALGTTIDASLLPVAHHGHVFVGGPGPVLIYPIGSGAARVNVDIPLDAPRGRDPLFCYVAERYRPHVPGYLLDPILRALEAQPILGASNHSVTTLSCATQGAVLLGDAGGCSHPLAATGMTSAVHDAITLTAALQEHDLRERSSEALIAYQRRRFGFVRAREAFAQALFSVFGGRGAGDRVLREAVFRYWHCPRARRVSMAILSGEESRARVLAAEYARVMMAAAMLGANASYRERSFAQSSAALGGLADGARTISRLAVDRIVTAARARKLHAPPGAPAVDSLPVSEARPPRPAIRPADGELRPIARTP